LGWRICRGLVGISMLHLEIFPLPRGVRPNHEGQSHGEAEADPGAQHSAERDLSKTPTLDLDNSLAR
jgi:hypothetical protein